MKTWWRSTGHSRIFPSFPYSADGRLDDLFPLVARLETVTVTLATPALNRVLQAPSRTHRRR